MALGALGCHAKRGPDRPRSQWAALAGYGPKDVCHLRRRFFLYFGGLFEQGAMELLARPGCALGKNSGPVFFFLGSRFRGPPFKRHPGWRTQRRSLESSILWVTTSIGGILTPGNTNLQYRPKTLGCRRARARDISRARKRLRLQNKQKSGVRGDAFKNLARARTGRDSRFVFLSERLYNTGGSK